MITSGRAASYALRPARFLAALSAFVVLVLVMAVGPVLPASAFCGSLCPTANTPMLVEMGTELGGAALGSGAALGIGSAGAPVAGMPLAVGASTAGVGSSVWGAALGKVGVLLGGLAAWDFIMPGADDPGLPPGSGSAGEFMGAAPWPLFRNVQFNIKNGVANNSYISYEWSRPASVGGGGGCAVRADGSQTSVSGWGSAGAYTWVASSVTAAGGTAASPLVYVRMFATNSNNVYPSPAFNAATMTCTSWSPTNATEIMHAGTAPGASVLPEREIELTITCKTASGVLDTISQTVSLPSGAEPGDAIPVAGLMCPEGSRLVGAGGTLHTEGGPDLAVLGSGAGFSEVFDSLTSGIPEECYSGGDCRLRLQRITPDGDWEDTDGEKSPRWQHDPGVMVGEANLGLGDSPKNVGTFRCVYGPGGAADVAVPISGCNIYGSTSGEPALPAEGETSAGGDDPLGDCSFGWTDLLTGAVLIRGGKCVIVWAFTPSSGTVEGLKAQLESRAPFTIASEAADGANAMVAAYSGAASCGLIADFTTSDIDGRIECDAFSKIPGSAVIRSLVEIALVALTGLYLFKLAASSIGAES